MQRATQLLPILQKGAAAFLLRLKSLREVFAPALAASALVVSAQNAGAQMRSSAASSAGAAPGSTPRVTLAPGTAQATSSSARAVQGRLEKPQMNRMPDSRLTRFLTVSARWAPVA
ncbi:hypothetical protein AD928_06595 [Acetobacter cerevisiae]|uniref:Uncharacterized protein n=2 Tax=Acetobacter cerevisiae TaxID=178900 RepID=A0A149QC79_9PROT|nr:hypothetical protein AD928_06595 [Acetobacter cerevisiae]